MVTISVAFSFKDWAVNGIVTRTDVLREVASGEEQRELEKQSWEAGGK